MKHSLLLTLFIGSYLFSCGQTPDTTGRKKTLWERRREQLMRVAERRQQEMMETRAQRVAEIEARPYRKADSAHWGLSLNPFSWLELQGAAGLGIGYQFNKHWQVWVESAGLFQFYQKPEQSCLGGIREILAVKYYFGLRQSFFLAGEFRYKDVYFHDVDNFTDQVNSVAIQNYTYKIEDIVFGGAGWFGGQIRLSDNHRWRLEPSIGLGLKGRTVVWHGVPPGWTYPKSREVPLFPNPVRTPERVTVYLPATVRVVYVL